MLKDDPDSSWETLARRDAYFGVLAEDKYSADKLNANHRNDFFLSGRDHIDAVIGEIERRFGRIPRGSALDFGCGVGRLVIPLARAFDSVVGVDVSPSMIDEAKRNCESAELGNVEFVLSQDDFAAHEGGYDFVNTYIVLMHIPTNRGMKILGRLIDAVNDGGAAAIQLLFARETNLLVKAVAKIRRNFWPLHYAINILSGKEWNYPLMQMNHYNMNRVLALLHKKGIRTLAVELSKRSTHQSATIMFKK